MQPVFPHVKRITHKPVTLPHVATISNLIYTLLCARHPDSVVLIEWSIYALKPFFHSFLYKTQTGVIANLTAFLKANVKNITLCYKRLRLFNSSINFSNSKRVTVRSTLEGLRWTISIKLLITEWSLCMFESTQKKKNRQFIHVFIRI